MRRERKGVRRSEDREDRACAGHRRCACASALWPSVSSSPPGPKFVGRWETQMSPWSLMAYPSFVQYGLSVLTSSASKLSEVCPA